MKRTLFIVAIMAALMIVGGSSLYAQPTAADTVIGNNVTATAINALSAATYGPVNITVETMVGAWYTGIPADASGAAGSTAGLIFTIVNRGNEDDIFRFVVIATQTNAAVPCGGAWTLTWVGGIDTASLAYNANEAKTLNVGISATAADAAYSEYQVEAQSLNSAAGVARTNQAYTGDNAVAYGGDIGLSWTGTGADDGILRHWPASTGGGTANQWIRVTVAGPVLHVMKVIDSAYPQMGGNACAAIPGATIRYVIMVTNVGSADATNVLVRDTVPTDTTYVAASAANNALGANDGTWAAPYLVGSSVRFTNTDALPAGGGQASFRFDVTID